MDLAFKFRATDLFSALQTRGASDAPAKVALLGVGDSTALLLNAIVSIKHVGIPTPDIVVGRFRSEAGNGELAATGVSIFFLDSLGVSAQAGEPYVEYGSSTFSDLMNIRFSFLQNLLDAGNIVISADVDIAWFRNPIPLLRKILKRFDWASQVEPTDYDPPTFCNGFFCMKPTPKAAEILELHQRLFAKRRQHDPKATTQPVFAQLLKARPQLRSRIFPLSEVMFPTGLSYRLFDEDSPQRHLAGTLAPFIFHANWTVGEEAKIQLLKRVGGWHLSE